MKYIEFIVEGIPNNNLYGDKGANLIKKYISYKYTL